MIHELSMFLRDHKETALSDIAYTLQQGREPMQVRLAVVVSSIEELSNVLEYYLKPMQGVNYPTVYFGNINEKNTETKFLFQGTAVKIFIKN